MYHVIVRDPKGRALPAQITNYQHDHRGASYDDLVFAYDFAAGEKRAVFTLEATATATPPETPCVYARIVPERLRRHGLGERPHRAPHVRLRAEHARRRRPASACAAAASTSGPNASAIPSSIAGMPRATISSTRTKKAKASISTASAGRAAPAARACGMARNSGPPTISSARRCCRMGRGARLSA